MTGTICQLFNCIAAGKAFECIAAITVFQSTTAGKLCQCIACRWEMWRSSVHSHLCHAVLCCVTAVIRRHVPRLRSVLPAGLWCCVEATRTQVAHSAMHGC